MKNVLFILFSLFLCGIAKSQEWKDAHVTLSAIRPAFPFSKLAGVISLPFHPLVECGATYQWNKSEKNRWVQNVNIGFGYHRFLQSIVPIYTTFGYSHAFKHKIEAGLDLGAGYLHSFPLNEQFTWKDGKYVRTDRFGKAQVIIRIGFNVQYKQVSLSYENFMQAPFIKSYVPLMPYNVITMGYHVPFQKIFKSYKKDKHEK